MEQLQHALQRSERRAARGRLAEARLDRLEVPVAEVVEDEVVEHVDGAEELEALQRVVDLGPRSVYARQDPALLERLGPQLDLTALAGEEQEAARVPQLVREL